MNNTKLIFFEFSILYQILNELNDFYNLELKYAKDINELKLFIKNNSDYLIITNNVNLKQKNQLILNNFPIEIKKILEKINVSILKNNYKKKSNVKIKNYRIDLNSREISLKNEAFKLTEKEIEIILYLFNSLTPVTIDELQKEIWGYSVELETHTVETHIHRLRKKINSFFKDQNFIISTKKGYKID